MRFSSKFSRVHLALSQEAAPATHSWPLLQQCPVQVHVSRSMQTISHVVLLFPQLASHTSTSGRQGQAWPRDKSPGNVRCVNKQSAPFSCSVKCISAINELVIFSFRCQEKLEKCHNSLYGKGF